jgi:hypothetical protein
MIANPAVLRSPDRSTGSTAGLTELSRRPTVGRFGEVGRPAPNVDSSARRGIMSCFSVSVRDI